ncbi:phospholipase carboxylesterase [Cordyceps militaris]|uniref:Phospholipase carboxylesterase n=1 Tax=Cordyceps militaris TaxID=73501 RepID=A0A2H4SDX3_CORMI|nr:phospholipase carboxylesterase [Cordyceps militaris]
MADYSYPRLFASCQQIITQFFQRRPLVASATLGLGLAAIPIISHIVRSYRGFLALGPGGLPYNFLGWSMQAIAQPLARHDTRESRPFADPRIFGHYAPHGRTAYLEDVPARRGERPEVPTYVAPQRQMNHHSDASRIEAMKRDLAGSVAQQAEVLTLAPSQLEGPKHQALWLGEAAEKPAYLAKSTRGEFAHVHPDGSSHLILSLADAETATAKGWAERHMLSGVLLPLNYVFVYAPRDEDELEVWQQFLAASISFNTASSEAACSHAS